MDRLSDIFKPVVEYLVDEATKDLDNGKWEDLLNAYNNYQKDERDCGDYIYNVDNNDDVIALLKNPENKFSELANATNDEYPFILLLPTGKISGIDGSTMIKMIKHYLPDIMECVIAYAPYIQSYNVIYKTYIPERLDE